MASHLSVAGIRPSNSIGPKGNHLRWSFPAHLGFPGDGFEVFRRKPDKKKEKDKLRIADLAALAADPASPQQGMTLALNAAGTPSVRLTFAERLAYFGCAWDNASGVVDIRVYGGVDGDRLIERRGDPREEGQVEFRFADITRVEIGLPFDKVSGIAFQTLESMSNAPWVSVMKLPVVLPDKKDQALERLEEDLENHYAATGTAAKLKYGNSVEALLWWLARVTDVAAPLEVIEKSSGGGEEIRGASLRVLPTLLLAALDPNIARMLSLYWVDPSADVFDYKIQGKWKEKGIVEGFALDVGLKEAPLPPAVPQSSAEEMFRLCRQLPGFSWKEKKPFGRMALRWAEPKAATEAAFHAVRPVLYDVIREGDGAHLTRERLALVTGNGRANKSQPLLIDPVVPLGPVQYLVSGIDLFGQKGGGAQLSGQAKKSPAPPPPIRLRCELSKDQKTLNGSFEFGAMQFSQTPDVVGFNLMWRADSPARRERVRIEFVSADEDENDQGVTLRYVVRVKTPAGEPFALDDLKNFESGVLETPRDDGLPASSRRTWRIERIADGLMHITSGIDHSPAGNRELVADPHHRGNWQEVAIPRKTKLDANPPLSAKLAADASAIFSVKATSWGLVDPPAMPSFDILPADARPSTVPSAESVMAMKEIVLDRDILDPSPWIGGEIEKGTRVNIQALLPAPSGSSGSRVRVGADWSVAKGNTLILHPAATRADEPVIRVLQIVPDGDPKVWLDSFGGEIAFEANVGGQEKLAIARIVASTVGIGAGVSVVVRVPVGVAGQLKAGKVLQYFRPYRFAVPVELSPATPGKIGLLLEDGGATRTGYLAVCARRGAPSKMTGPLCAPVGFTVVRPAPTGKPDAPFPKGFSGGETDGYATPPDAEGRSTVELEWTAGGVQPPVSLRYEVARALDTAIPVAHRRSWLRGASPDNTHSILPGITCVGTLSQVPVEVDPRSGLYQATFTPDTSPPPDADFRGGRLQQGANYFEITFAARRTNDFRLLLRNVGKAPLTNNRASITAPPDYTHSLEDTAALKAIASENPEVFALATGSAIAATTFRDEVPGLGSGRFFYRVRALDPAGNATAWSDVSVPFHQVDTSPPKPLDFTAATGGEKQSTLEWLFDSDVAVCLLYRSTVEAALEHLGQLAPTLVIQNLPPPTGATISFTDRMLPGLPRGEFYYYRLVAVRRVQRGPALADVLEIRSQPNAVVRVAVIDTVPPSSPADFDAVRVSLSSGDSIRLTWAADEKLDYLVRRRETGSQLLVARTDWIEGGILDSAIGQWRYEYLDQEGVIPGKSYTYQVKVRNADGRMASSAETEPV